MKTSQEAIDFIHQSVYQSNFSPIIDKPIEDLEAGLKALLDSCCINEKPQAPTQNKKKGKNKKGNNKSFVEVASTTGLDSIVGILIEVKPKIV